MIPSYSIMHTTIWGNYYPIRMVLDKGSIVVLGMNINRFGTGVTRLGSNFGTSARGASLNEIGTTGGWRCAHMWQ